MKRDEMQTKDSTIYYSSRRSAMLRLTAMVSTAFIGANKANADDEFKILEESDEIDKFLLNDEKDDDLGFRYASRTSYSDSDASALRSSTESFVDPWEKFAPRVTPDDESALSVAFASSTPPASVASSSVVRTPSTIKTSSTESTQKSASASKDQELSTDHMDAGSLFALTFPIAVLGGAAISFEKEKSIIENADNSQHTATGTPRVKVVMVENEPYGLDKGRRYYNGVYVVREFCDASAPKVTNECAHSIAEYLENVSHTGGVGEENQQTASAIISYLDGLSSGGSPTATNQHHEPQATGVAFSSYLQGLSEGSIPAPASAESVALYLDSLASKERERISRLEARVDELQSTMDDKVAKELIKIATFLVEKQSNMGNTAYDDFEVNNSGLNGEHRVNGSNAHDFRVNGYGVRQGSGYGAGSQIPNNLRL
jgi:hypothetical protein